MIGSGPVRIDGAVHRIRKKSDFMSNPVTKKIYENLKRDLQQEYHTVWHQNLYSLTSFTNDVEEWTFKRTTFWRRRVLQLRAHYDEETRFLSDRSTYTIMDVFTDESSNNFRILLTLRRGYSHGQPFAFRTLTENDIVGTGDEVYDFPGRASLSSSIFYNS